MRPESAQPLDISKPWQHWPDMQAGATVRGTTTVFRAPAPESEMAAQLDASPTLAALKLNRYIGLCFVVDASGCNAEITSATMLKLFAEVEELLPNGMVPQRVLIKTGFDCNLSANYPCLTPDALLFLLAKGILLVGTDCPSIDLPEGHAINEMFMQSHKMVWVVNLNLSEVKPLRPYILSALPLIPGATGQVPTRAILIPIGPGEDA